MTIRITLAPSREPQAIASCFLCARRFTQGHMIALLTVGQDWRAPICSECLPNGQDDTVLRESALNYREYLLRSAQLMERIGFGPPIESPTREDLEWANSLPENSTKEEKQLDAAKNTTTVQ